jgi:nicotinamide mononucleotide transporter
MLNTAITLFGTAVTWLEIAAFVLAIACVVCNVYEIHWAWPLTIASSALYAWLFFASKLYGDGALQFLFIAIAFWGWWQWRFGTRLKHATAPLRVAALPRHRWPLIVGVWGVLWLIIGAFLKRYTDTDVPWWDAFPTAGSVIGQYLLARKFIENWPVWIGVNAVAITLFAFKGLVLTAILYAIFLAMAFWGWRVWCRAQKIAPQV